MSVVFGIIYTWLYCTLMCLALSQHHAAWPSVLSVMCLALSQHHTALLLIDTAMIVGLSITSPGSHVPQHRWYQHHVSRLALMLALMCLAVATDPQFVPHPRFAQA